MASICSLPGVKPANISSPVSWVLTPPYITLKASSCGAVRQLP
jgi:hypothetical protein